MYTIVTTMRQKVVSMIVIRRKITKKKIRFLIEFLEIVSF